MSKDYYQGKLKFTKVWSFTFYDYKKKKNTIQLFNSKHERFGTFLTPTVTLKVIGKWNYI